MVWSGFVEVWFGLVWILGVMIDWMWFLLRVVASLDDLIELEWDNHNLRVFDVVIGLEL